MPLNFQALQKHYAPRAVLALTLEPGELCAVPVRARGAERLVGAEGESLRIALDAEALCTSPGLAAKAGGELAAALERAGIRERRAVVCLPPAWVLTTTAELPELSAQDRRGYLSLRAEREFAQPDLSLASSFWDFAQTRRATLAALPARRMEALRQLLAAAGCRAVAIQLALPGLPAASLAHEPELHLALSGDQRAPRDQKEPTDSPAARQVTIAVAAAGGWALLRTIPAEPVAFARELRISLGRLPEGLRRGLARVCVHGDRPPGELVAVLENTGFPHIETAPATAATLAVGPASAWLRQQTGLAAEATEAAFEFLEPEPGPWSRWEARLNRLPLGRRPVALAAAVVLLALLCGLWRWQTEKGLSREWERMRASVTELELMQQGIRQMRPWFDPMPQKLQALQAVISAFPEQGETWARSVHMTPYIDPRAPRVARGTQALPGPVVQVSLSGCARSREAALELQTVLARQPGVSNIQQTQTRGNNPVQFSFNLQWEPKN